MYLLGDPRIMTAAGKHAGTQARRSGQTPEETRLCAMLTGRWPRHALLCRSSTYADGNLGRARARCCAIRVRAGLERWRRALGNLRSALDAIGTRVRNRPKCRPGLCGASRADSMASIERPLNRSAPTTPADVERVIRFTTRLGGNRPSGAHRRCHNARRHRSSPAPKRIAQHLARRVEIAVGVVDERAHRACRGHRR